MFKKSRKKAPPPPTTIASSLQSRAGNYVITGPESTSLAGGGLHQKSLLVPGTSASGLPSPQQLRAESVGSVNSVASSGSEDTSTSSGSRSIANVKKGALTFRTFLGTPQMGRKNAGGDDVTVSDRKPPKGSKYGGGELDCNDNRGEKVKPEVTKKQSVMSKVIQRLSTPRSKHKLSSDTPGHTSTSTFSSHTSRSKSRHPPPPPPKRVSSLTREDERKGQDGNKSKWAGAGVAGSCEDIHFVNITDMPLDDAAKPDEVRVADNVEDKSSAWMDSSPPVGVGSLPVVLNTLPGGDNSSNVTIKLAPVGNSSIHDGASMPPDDEIPVIVLTESLVKVGEPGEAEAEAEVPTLSLDVDTIDLTMRTEGIFQGERQAQKQDVALTTGQREERHGERRGEGQDKRDNDMLIKGQGEIQWEKQGNRQIEGQEERQRERQVERHIEGEEESESCDTLQSVEGISEDEVSESLSSTASVSRHMKPPNDPSVPIRTTTHMSQIEVSDSLNSATCVSRHPPNDLTAASQTTTHLPHSNSGCERPVEVQDKTSLNEVTLVTQPVADQFQASHDATFRVNSSSLPQVEPASEANLLTDSGAAHNWTLDESGVFPLLTDSILSDQSTPDVLKDLSMTDNTRNLCVTLDGNLFDKDSIFKTHEKVNASSENTFPTSTGSQDFYNQEKLFSGNATEVQRGKAKPEDGIVNGLVESKALKEDIPVIDLTGTMATADHSPRAPPRKRRPHDESAKQDGALSAPSVGSRSQDKPEGTGNRKPSKPPLGPKPQWSKSPPGKTPSKSIGVGERSADYCKTGEMRERDVQEQEEDGPSLSSKTSIAGLQSEGSSDEGRQDDTSSTSESLLTNGSRVVMRSKDGHLSVPSPSTHHSSPYPSSSNVTSSNLTTQVSSSTYRRSLQVARAVTPTQELYTTWGEGNARSLPSPPTVGQPPAQVLVETDYSEGHVLETKPSKVTPRSQAVTDVRLQGQHTDTTGSSVRSRLLRQERLDCGELGGVLPSGALSESAADIEADLEVSAEFRSPRRPAPRPQASLSLHQRSSTPTIDQMRNLQRRRVSTHSEFSRDSLTYRPSTPVISTETMHRRSKASGGVSVVNVPMPRTQAALELLSPRRLPLMSSQSMFDNLGTTTSTAGSGGPYEGLKDRWSTLGTGVGTSTGGTSPSRNRPPSPVIRAKVNSVLDGLLNKPFTGTGTATRRPVVARSKSAEHLLSGAPLRLLSDSPAQGESLVGRYGHLLTAASVAAVPASSNLRPPSPFLSSPDLGASHHSFHDIDIEFDTVLPPSGLVSDVYVPPLDLDFIKQPREGENAVLSQRSVGDRTQPQLLPQHNPVTTSAAMAQTGTGPPVATFPGFRSTLADAAPLPPGDHELVPSDTETNAIDTPDISSSCLELVPSDSESDSEVDSGGPGGRGGVRGQPAWRTKALDSWTVEDVALWATTIGFPHIAEVLKGHGIKGEDLPVLQEHHLVEMGVQDGSERQQFMTELQKLKLKPKSAASLWRLKQTSMKRRNLEASSELLQERIHRLQCESSKQERRIDTSMEELLKHQQQTERLLATKGVTDGGDTYNSAGRIAPSVGKEGDIIPGRSFQFDVPLVKWTTDDVSTWLRASRLERFVPTFKAHHVTGKDLAGISMQLLDDLNIESTEDKEQLLSKLYELQRPSQDHDTPSNLIGADSTNQEPGQDQLTMELPSVGMATDPTCHSLQSKLKGMVSPRKFGGRLKDMETIRVWHDVTGSVGSTSLKISESSSSELVINDVLEELEMTEDTNLFYLTAASGSDREVFELGRYECPLSLLRKTVGGSTRFELRRRLGITIKVICQISNMKPRGKGFRVSPISTYTDIRQVALRKFRMSHVDVELFCLLPINKETGDVRLMAETEIVQDCETDSFILCNQENVDQLLASSDDTLPLLQQNTQILRRNSSLNSHGSSALSQSSDASQGSDHGKPRFEKLESLEAQMADIEASLSGVNEGHARSPEACSPGRGPGQMQMLPTPSARRTKQPERLGTATPSTNQNPRYISARKQTLPSNDKFYTQEFHTDDQLELMREIALMKQSAEEKDSIISSLKEQNNSFKLQAKQVEELRAQLAEVTRRIHQQQDVRWQHQPPEINVRLGDSATADDDSDSGRDTNRSSSDNLAELDLLEKELHSAQSEARALEEELSISRTRHQGALQEASLTGNTVNAQLLAEDCTITEAKLLQAKQKHADLYARVELLKKEQQTPPKHMNKEPWNLFRVLYQDCPQEVTTIELPPGGDGFLHGRDAKHRLIVRHVTQGLPLQKGDRLLEVNGEQVFHLDDQQVSRVLRQAHQPIRIVITRDAQKKSGGSSVHSQDMESMREDLSLAMMEVESLQQENQDLTQDVERLKSSNRQLEAQIKEMRERLSQQSHGSNRASQSESSSPPEGENFTRRGEPTAKKKLRFGDDVLTSHAGRENVVLKNGTGNGPELKGAVIAYDLLDQSLPLWESLRTASKGEILQVLKDHILETHQQKTYLDQLMAVVIDNAPELIDHVDGTSGLDEPMCWKPNSEEFC